MKNEGFKPPIYGISPLKMKVVGWLVADVCPPKHMSGNKQSATDGTNQVGSKYWWIVPRVFGGLKNRATSTTVVDDVVVRHV